MSEPIHISTVLAATMERLRGQAVVGRGYIHGAGALREVQARDAVDPCSCRRDNSGSAGLTRCACGAREDVGAQLQRLRGKVKS